MQNLWPKFLKGDFFLFYKIAARAQNHLKLPSANSCFIFVELRSLDIKENWLSNL